MIFNLSVLNLLLISQMYKNFYKRRCWFVKTKKSSPMENDCIYRKPRLVVFSKEKEMITHLSSLERKTRLELATLTLARLCSTN